MSERWEAGAETDAAIARRVFGGPTQHPEWYWWNTANWGGWYAEGYSLPEGAEAGPFCGPKFSEQIAAAMAVFEAVVGMAGAGGINADMEDARGEGFVVSAWFGMDDDAVGASGPPALAICRAALHWLAALDSAGEGEG